MDTVKRRRLLLIELLVGAVIAVVIIARASFQAPVPGSLGVPAAPAMLDLPTTLAGIGGDWTMEGYNPGRTRALPAPVSLPMSRQREVLVPGDTGSGSPPSIVGNTMVIEAEKTLRAIDLGTGVQRWAINQRGSYISPAIAGDRVYIRAESDNKGNLLALDFKTGKQLWAFTPQRLSSAENGYYGGHLTSPVVVGNLVFVGAGKEIYALDAATGATRWVYTTQDFVTSSASVDSGRVYISDFSHFYALSQQSGKLLWVLETPTSISFSAVAAGETVLVTNGDNMSALNAATGKERWIAHYTGEQLIPAAVQGTRAFVKSTNTLYALDLASGKELWHYTDLNFVSLPAIAGDQVFMVTGNGADTAVQARRADSGAVMWQQPVHSLTNTAPVIAGQTLYVRTTQGRVIGFWQ